MSFEIFFKMKNSKFGEGVIFQEFRDKFYLIAGGKGHAVWRKYCFPRKKDKTPADTAIPMGVCLGDRYEAVEMLKRFLKALNETP